MDLFDWLVIVGIVLLGIGLWLAWGWVAALGYAGMVLIVAGIVGGALRGPDGRNQ